jgi:PAS domain S-box-containing protein
MHILNSQIHQVVRKSDIAVAAVLVVTLAILAGSRSVHYLFFHVMAELFAIVVSLSIFILTWTSSRYLASGYLIILGGAYGAIGLVDVFHTLTFRGMSLFPGVSPNYPTQFWLTARYLEAIALLCGPLFIGRKPNFFLVSAGFAAIAAAASVSVMAQWFPATYIDGVGLTPFKVNSEYLIIAMLIAGFILLYRARRTFAPRIFFLLAASLWLAVATEFCFTRYVNFYDFTNELGHYLRFISVALAFVAVVISGVREPFDLIFREVGEHKRKLEELNQKLIESEDQLTRAQNVAQVGSWHLDAARNQLTASAEAGRMLGIPIDMPQTFETFCSRIHPNDLESVFKAWDRAVQGQIFSIEHRVVVGDMIRWVRERTEITFAGDGSRLAALSTVQDITERKQAEELLRESEESYRRQFSDNMAVMILLDPSNGRIIDANSAAAEFYGYSRTQMMAMHITEINPIPVTEARRLMNSVTPAKGKHFELQHRLADGSLRAVDVFSSQIRLGERLILHVIIHDITDRKHAEAQITLVNEELRQLNETLESRVRERTAQLEGANTMLEASTRELTRSNQELERFAYVASHDLQEPVRTVVGFIQLLEKRLAGKLDAESTEFMRHAVGGALHMRRMIQDVLTYSRVGARAASPKMTDAGEAVQGALALLGSQISSAGAMVETMPLPLVNADHTQLVQLFQNLIGNAIKFCQKEIPRVRIEARRDDAFWRFTITDNGIGIAAEYRERIFVIFQRLHTREAYDGTGLGLAICKRIVQGHGGEIGVDSASGGGSAFWFTIPDKNN